MNYYCSEETKNYMTLLGDCDFIWKYLELDKLKRLRNVGYFCGMDKCSKNIYQFKYYISRLDHSITTALLTYKLTNDKASTIAALFHDIDTPCFSHVIDYMNKDYANQESTESNTENVLLNMDGLEELLEQDGLVIPDIFHKNYSIVDTDRPKLCADRLDGIILTSLAWTKKINIYDVKRIIDDTIVINNEDNEEEIGFSSKETALYISNLESIINDYTHSNDDTFCMLLLADITKYAIKMGYVNVPDLYILNEGELWNIFESMENIDDELAYNLTAFRNMNANTKLNFTLDIKKRLVSPLYPGCGKRF